MTIDQSSTNMAQMMQNSDALTKLSVAKDMIPESPTSEPSLSPDPTGEAMQALTYGMEGQVMAIQGALAASIVSISV